MQFTIFIFIFIMFLAHMSYYRDFEVTGTALAYGVVEHQIVLGIPVYSEVIMDGLTYKEAVIRCEKLKNQQ